MSRKVINFITNFATFVTVHYHCKPFLFTSYTSTSIARHSSQHNTTRHAATLPNWYSEINVTFYSVALARTIWLADDGPRTETCRSVLMCKFYMSAVVGIIIE